MNFIRTIPVNFSLKDNKNILFLRKNKRQKELTNLRKLWKEKIYQNQYTFCAKIFCTNFALTQNIINKKRMFKISTISLYF